MRNGHRPTAAEAARLAVYLVFDYDKEKHKNTSRFRISSKTLRRMSGRAVLRDAFIEEWEDALSDLGWSTLRVGDYFGLIRTATIDDWSRISSLRIKTLIEKIRSNDPNVWDKIEASIEPSDGGDEHDED
jgi:hypothetical protein